MQTLFTKLNLMKTKKNLIHANTQLMCVIFILQIYKKKIKLIKPYFKTSSSYVMKSFSGTSSAQRNANVKRLCFD